MSGSRSREASADPNPDVGHASAADLAESVPGHLDVGGPEPVPEDPRSLNGLVRGGLKWSFVSVVLGRLLTPITSIVLAHLLVPADFGVFSLAVVAGTALTSFNDLGVTNAVVRWTGDVRRAAQTATTLAIASSLALYTAIFVAAPRFCSAMGAPGAVGVLRAVSFTVVIDGISSVPGGLLTREFRQGRRAAAEWVGFAVSTGLTIVLAANGFGAWSLAWGRLVGNSLNTIGLYAFVEERPRPGWDRAVARELISFGLPLAASSLLLFVMLNTDYLIVGRVNGTTALGLYTMAFNLSSWPSSILTGTIRRVSVPAFSRLRDDPEALERSYLTGLRNLTVLAVPLAAALAVLSGPLVKFLYPPRYRPAADALALLAVLGGFRVLLDFTYDLFVAIGRSRTLLALQAVWGAALVPALVVGAETHGIRGVATGHVVVLCAVVLPAYLLVLGRAGVHRRAAANVIGRVLGAGVAGAGAGWAVAVALGGGPAGLFGGGLTLAAVYLLLVMPLREYRQFVPRILDFAEET